MTKDYAKKRVKSSKGTKPRHASASPLLPGWLWLMMGVMLGVGLAFFIFWKWGQNYQYEPPQPPLVISENDSAPVEDITLDQDAGKNRFDFYTLLPDLKVDVPDVSAPTTKKPAHPSPIPEAFILQAGSFKTSDQADKLRATLALNGFESSIQTVEIPPNETWYRVYIGPFATKSEALVMQQNLKQSLASNSLILKIRV